VLGEQVSGDSTGDWRARFETALQHFRLRTFNTASEHFHEVLRLRSGDGPSQFYLQQIAQFQAVPPPVEWLGEIELREK
jgi:hypothetical protein